MQKIHKNLSRRDALAIIAINQRIAENLEIVAEWTADPQLIAKMNQFAKYLRDGAKNLANIFAPKRSI